MLEAQRSRSVPGAEQYLEPWPNVPGCDGELRPIRASGVFHVRKQQVDRLVAPQYLQRSRSVGSGYDLVAELAQTVGCDGQDILIVFHEQDRAVAGRR